MQLEANILNKVIAEAKSKSSGNPACLRAIDRAAALLKDGNWSFDNRYGVLTVASSDNKKLYRANGSCQCRAFVEFKHSMCRHRIAARLLTRYHEQIPAPVRPQARPFSSLAVRAEDAAKGDRQNVTADPAPLQADEPTDDGDAVWVCSICNQEIVDGECLDHPGARERRLSADELEAWYARAEKARARRERELSVLLRSSDRGVVLHGMQV